MLKIFNTLQKLKHQLKTKIKFKLKTNSLKPIPKPNSKINHQTTSKFNSKPNFLKNLIYKTTFLKSSNQPTNSKFNSKTNQQPNSKPTSLNFLILKTNLKSILKPTNQITISILTIVTLLVGIKTQQNEILNKILGSVDAEAGNIATYGTYNNSLNDNFSNPPYNYFGTNYSSDTGIQRTNSWLNPITYQNRCVRPGQVDNITSYQKTKTTVGTQYTGTSPKPIGASTGGGGYAYPSMTHIDSATFTQTAGPTLTVPTNPRVFNYVQTVINNPSNNVAPLATNEYGLRESSTFAITAPNSVGQTTFANITGAYRYSMANIATENVFTDTSVYLNYYIDSANTAPTTTTTTSNSLTVNGASVSIPINFTVADTQSNTTTNIVELSNNNFSTILQSQTFTNTVVGTTINHTFTNVPIGTYKWRVRTAETGGTGTCATYPANMPKQPIPFKMMVDQAPVAVGISKDNLTTNYAAITVTGANGTGSCSGRDTVQTYTGSYPLNCTYTPTNNNFVGMDTVAINMPAYGSTAAAIGYQKIDFNPLPLTPTLLTSSTGGDVVVSNNPSPIGNVDGVSTTTKTVNGWVCDASDFNYNSAIHIYVDGPVGVGAGMTGTGTSGLAREAAVGSLCGGNSNHGFAVPITPQYWDNQPHTYYVYVFDNPTGTPVLLGQKTGTIPPSADLQITKTLTSTALVKNANANYKLSIKNNGPNATTGTTTVTDVLPSNLTYISATGTGWTCSAGGTNNKTVTCTNPTSLANAAVSDIALVVKVG
jgi:hypothetical protein